MIILSDNKKNQSFGETVAQTENKLIVLYLIDKMDVPLSNSEISQFILEEDIMNYFDLQQIMAELLETSYLEAIGESGSVRFILADEVSKPLAGENSSARKWNFVTLSNDLKCDLDFIFAVISFLKNSLNAGNLQISTFSSTVG